MKVSGKVLGCKLRHHLHGELKWRYCSPGNQHAGNPLLSRSAADRETLSLEFDHLIAGCPVTSIADSPNSDKAERTALMSAYMLLAAPVINIGLSGLNSTGPVGFTTRWAAMQYFGSNWAATDLANGILGPEQD